MTNSSIATILSYFGNEFHPQITEKAVIEQNDDGEVIGLDLSSLALEQLP